jgi:predicted RNA-binding Zn-ribbon protein involved in translation (DUF1610 family)
VAAGVPVLESPELVCSVRPRRSENVFLIFGVSVSEAVVAAPVFVCGRCGNRAPHRLAQQARKLSLFFIPLIPMGSKYYDTCTACGHVMEVDRQQAEAAAQQAGPDLR